MGLITLTEGNVQDYDYIKAKILEYNELYDIQSIAFDRWNSSHLVNQLTEEANIFMSPFGQGWASMSTPTKELERLVMQKKIIHNNNPLLRWQVSCASVKRDPADNIKIVKDKSSDKVDGVVALVMSIGDFLSDDGDSNNTSVYNEKDLLIL